jgi:hypothetical protein
MYTYTYVYIYIGAYEKLIASTLPELPAIKPHPSSSAEHRYPDEIPKYVFEKKYVFITKEDRKKNSLHTHSNSNNFASVSSKKNADERFYELSTDMLRSLLKEFGYLKPPGYPVWRGELDTCIRVHLFMNMSMYIHIYIHVHIYIHIDI